MASVSPLGDGRFLSHLESIQITHWPVRIYAFNQYLAVFLFHNIQEILHVVYRLVINLGYNKTLSGYR